uniref:Murein L,D-transpeptidase YafK n=1 Tax=Candidatus Kentrum sp. FW TaxID=2126338 RepID=A0A450S1N1_9GAMM|nr:MAG: Murein L,D-transpeptidase YafK [Candidatus Kentron sp. FW]VFJ57123.1 MAG: Murein L,D-transpeptidase YafK [Candidatus Kentron sp. FW]
MMRRIFPPAFIAIFLFVSGIVPVTGITLILDTHIDTDSPRKHDSLSETTERILMDSLHAIRNSRMDVAMRGVESLVETHPEFRLAQLVYGDLLLSKSHLITDVGSYPDAPPDKVIGLREEARQRFQHHLRFSPLTTLPEYLVRLAGDFSRVIVVDISQSRLYLYEGHGKEVRLRGDYYVSVGKNGFPKRLEGDKKTPIGVYVTTGSIPPDTLPDRYGVGAFPINYPNEWDKRFGRTGDGIWIHGVPKDTYSRTPRASDGCIAIANEDLLLIKDILAAPNTPVILAKDVSWAKHGEIAAFRRRFEERFEDWRRDWESLDHRGYAKYYSQDFRNETKDRTSWLRHKRHINAMKRYVKVDVSNLIILGYPGERNMLVVTFDQNYRSNNYSGRRKKRQYWRQEKDDGTWRIVYENVISRIQ